MATLSKKINMINSAGTQQTANLYSTTAESGSPYLSAMVDGTAAYAPLVSPSDSRATSGRVTRTDGTTYAIGKSAAPAYAQWTQSAAGSGTFTVPSGVSKLRVTCVGGGAGGAVLWNVATSTTSLPNTAGRATTFGSVTANGAVAADFVLATETNCSWDRDSQSCSTSITGFRSCNPSHGTASGTCAYSKNGIGGAGAVPLTDYNGNTVFSAGAGGGADGEYDYVVTGGSGFKTVSVIDVTPGQVISWTVGGSAPCYNGYGWCGSFCSNRGMSCWTGSVGGILVEYGQGIE